MKKKRLAIIGTVGVPAAYGGFETLVEQLLPYIENKFEVTVYCSGKFYSDRDRPSHYGKAKLKYIPLYANGICSIPYDMWSILHATVKSDILLILGVSGCTILPFIKFFSRKKFYVNIDGIEWKRDKWNFLIKAFLRYSEIFAVEVAEGIITDNQVIKAYIKATYDYESYLIEYGGDQTSLQPISEKALQKYPYLNTDYAFSVCRIEPENNTHVILEAMAEQREFPCVFVGNWDKSNYGKDLKERYNQFDHLHLLDPIYEPIELNTLRSNCYLYLHGHSAGGTNPSIVEAMNLSLPIIAYNVMYNRESTEDKALFFKTADDLKDILENLTLEKRNDVAISMYKIAKRRYTWEVIANKYINMMLPNSNYRKTASKSDSRIVVQRNEVISNGARFIDSIK